MANEINEIEGACESVSSNHSLPPQTKLVGQPVPATLGSHADQPHSARPRQACDPIFSCRAETSSGDRRLPVTRDQSVARDVPDDLHNDDNQFASVIGDIIHHFRRYDDLRRARQRLDLQVKAIQRRYGEGAPIEVWCLPYYEAMGPLDAAIAAEEKLLTKLGKQHPLADFTKSVAGLSDRFLALIQGEAGRPISDYRNPACLWKRMGMAVIQGGRQRRVAGDAALEHGYAPHRRALMWNVGESMLKQQLRKGEDGERYAIGPYGQVYIDRRAHEVASKGEKYSHARAKRYMEKRLLREIWKASRQ